jgi:multidrug efflux pump subunit AcrA (membrane-fusion protein)
MKFQAFAYSVLFAAVVISTQALAVEDKSKPAIVFTKKMHAAELADELTYPARVLPKINTTILAETDGIVSKIHAPLGQRVAKNEKLITIKHTDPVYQYAPVTIKSSVAGVVSSVEVTEGTQVAKGTKLGTVTDPTQVSVVIEVPAQDLTFLKREMTGELQVRGTDKKTNVKVKGISPFVDPVTGTASCELELTDTSLAPGQLAQVRFKTNVRNGFSVSDDVVGYKGNDPFVNTVEDGKLKRVPVKLGGRKRGQVEILEGLSENTEVIERTSRYVPEGEAIVVEGAAKPEEKKI